MTLDNPIRAIREISHDQTCTRRVRLASGREVSALEIQSEYLDRALKYADSRDLDPQEKQALQMWEHCLTQIANDPLNLTRECDWVMKHHLIEAYRERHGLALSRCPGGAVGPPIPRCESVSQPLLPDAEPGHD